MSSLVLEVQGSHPYSLISYSSLTSKLHSEDLLCAANAHYIPVKLARMASEYFTACNSHFLPLIREHSSHPF